MGVSISGGASSQKQGYLGNTSTASTTDITALSITGSGKLMEISGQAAVTTIIIDGQNYTNAFRIDSFLVPVSGSSPGNPSTTSIGCYLDLPFSQSLVIQMHSATGTANLAWHYEK